MAHSRFGVALMSHAFFSREWTQIELDGIVALQVAPEIARAVRGE